MMLSDHEHTQRWQLSLCLHVEFIDCIPLWVITNVSQLAADN